LRNQKAETVDSNHQKRQVQPSQSPGPNLAARTKANIYKGRAGSVPRGLEKEKGKMKSEKGEGESKDEGEGR